MNLGMFFKKEDDVLLLDYEHIQKETDEEFVQCLAEGVPNGTVKEMKFAEKKKVTFVYYQIGAKWYSFAWDKRERTIIASEQIYTGSGWRFIVGHMYPTL